MGYRVKCSGLHIPDPVWLRASVPTEYTALSLHTDGVDACSVYIQTISQVI